MLTKINVPFLGIVRASLPCFIHNMTYLKQANKLFLNLSLTFIRRSLTSVWAFPTKFVPFELREI